MKLVITVLASIALGAGISLVSFSLLAASGFLFAIRLLMAEKNSHKLVYVTTPIIGAWWKETKTGHIYQIKTITDDLINDIPKKDFLDTHEPVYALIFSEDEANRLFKAIEHEEVSEKSV